MSHERSPRPRTVPLPRRGRRLALAAAFGLVAGVVTIVGLRVSATRRQQAWKAGAAARAIEAAHARPIASGEQVTVLHGAGRGAVVVRLPGRLVRRGTDVLRVPDVVAAPGAVSLMPGGQWAIDASGLSFDVSSAEAIAECPRRPCVWTRTEDRRHGRVVQITSDGVVRREDGSVATLDEGRSGNRHVSRPRSRAVESRTVDLAEQGALVELHVDGTVFRYGRHRFYEGGNVSLKLPVPEPQEVVTRADLICVRGRRGEVRCARSTVPAEHLSNTAVLTAIEGTTPERVAQLALGPGGLCVVGFDGRLSCAPLPHLGSSAESPFALSLVEGLGAVTAAAVGTGVTCARLRTGDVRCWGDLLDRGGIVRRDAPVAIAGLDAVEHIVTVGRRVCALQRGEVFCWGARWSHRSEEGPAGAVQRVPTEGPVVDLGASWQNLCVVLVGGRVRCTDGDPDVLTWRGPEGAVPEREREFAAAVRGHLAARAPLPFGDLPPPTEDLLESGIGSGCQLGAEGGVRCRRFEGSEVTELERVTFEEAEERFAPVPGLTDAVELALAPSGLVCARRATGQVVCWGANVDGLLTAADHPDRGRRYRLSELLDRAAR